MIQLAVPGLAMIMAEWLAFEVLTLAASYLSTAHLAAQCILSTVCAIAFHLPFPMSIAASTRVANLVGAGRSGDARKAAGVAAGAAFVVGVVNCVVLLALRLEIPRFFSSDVDVVRITTSVLPVCIVMQLFDSPATMCNGIIRGIGNQRFGGYMNIIAYYAVGIPIALGACFWAGFGIHGLWVGLVCALLL
jgi:MATE family multidrug resistance protein